jgi:hypothetical protein
MESQGLQGLLLLSRLKLSALGLDERRGHARRLALGISQKHPQILHKLGGGLAKHLPDLIMELNCARRLQQATASNLCTVFL